MTSLTLAPHLEAAVERMSKDLGLAPEAVVQQAVAAWLRTNGYSTTARSLRAESRTTDVPVVPEKPAVSTAVTPAVVPDGATALVPSVIPSPPEADPRSVRAPEGATSLVPAADPRSVRAESRTSVAPAVEEKPSPSAQSTALARMAEIDADLAALAKPWPAWSEDAAAAEDEAEQDDEAPQDDEAAPPEDEEPNTGRVPVQPDPEEEEPPPESTIVLKSVPVVLYLQRGDEEPVRITQDRFIIGRGPHCDLIIDSPRVSREHVALTRVGIMYFLEDLNSSNGTWFNEERVTKKELESGDVISLGNEPVTFFLRGE